MIFTSLLQNIHKENYSKIDKHASFVWNYIFVRKGFFFIVQNYDSLKMY